MNDTRVAARLIAVRISVALLTPVLPPPRADPKKGPGNREWCPDSFMFDIFIPDFVFD